jgi:hypothetical protein
MKIIYEHDKTAGYKKCNTIEIEIYYCFKTLLQLPAADGIGNISRQIAMWNFEYIRRLWSNIWVETKQGKDKCYLVWQ